ncbi:CHAT domain-containing protein OS=Streptomyces microflavus OX=1919 GN=Smic_72750 PE=4 SV=1 [Streptomyces microflavus]
MAGLREAATVVLLQVAAEPALQMARSAADRALQIARWCLADGDLAAVEAMELGRGQVLHASTTTADVPALLREAGREDLAEEWEGGARAPVVQPIWRRCSTVRAHCWAVSARGRSCRLRNDLRQRVLTALARREGSALMAPPAPGEIGAALRRADADALVYLLPPGGGGGSGGTAVVVTREGEVATVGFGLMRKDGLDVLEAYREAHRHRQDVLDRTDDPEVHTAAHARWRSALEELCGLGRCGRDGPARTLPLLRAAGPQPRLVLVPFGVLGGIPGMRRCSAAACGTAAGRCAPWSA